MCTVSMVMDQWRDRFPGLGSPPLTAPYSVPTPWLNTPPLSPLPNAEEIKRLFALIQDFREEVRKAREHDKATNQPDCEDVEKIKLVDRVAALEKRLHELEAR